METTKKIKEQVQEIYWEISKRCRYDLDVGMRINNELLLDGVSVSEMLEKSKLLVDTFHLGTSINFSLALIAKLKEKEIEAFLISTTPSDNFAVGYQDEENNIFVANIGEDIRISTKEDETVNKLPKRSLQRCKENFSIPINTFKDRNKKVRRYSCVFLTQGTFFSDFLSISREL